jgi:hypothetical protein
MMFALTMMVSLEWTDHRLKFNNLKKGKKLQEQGPEGPIL